MALTSGRKLCKLDAICAKLKQISDKDTSKKPDENEENAEENGHVEPNPESPLNFSNKCSNNNVIGKADLNSLDSEVKENGLDLSFKIKEPVNEDKKEENEDINKCDSTESENGLNSSPTKVLEEKPSIKPIIGSGRRKRAVPRSIPQMNEKYDHSENHSNQYYKENHAQDAYSAENGVKRMGSLEASINDDSNSSVLNLSKSSAQSKDSQRSRLSSDAEMNFGTPLDLSMSRSREDDDSINSYLSTDDEDRVEDNMDDNSDDADDDDDFFHPDRNLTGNGTKVPKSASGSIPGPTSSNSRFAGPGHAPGSGHCSEQADHLKDYAESTMNELISMYGFGGASGTHPGDLSKHVPIRNFSNILQQVYKEPQSPASLGQSHSAASIGQMSSGDEESHDGSNMSFKGIYANYANHPSNKAQGGGKPQNDRFTSSSSFINAVYNANNMGHNAGHISPGLPNYSKYLKRYNTGGECGGQHCKDLGYREHYHCIDCSFQVFVKKEEMVRHYKWHRKREESLQHGFLRFSPLDNCSKRFGHCTHNGKQTHYHCLQKGCDKVYISTSDVQMHANYHRKDSAIMSEGFQRFRATEDCGTLACAFYGQRTTHFHCLRPECKFTFKNKADMEKHKSYHQKDEVLGRDGFKKFMKYEHCMYQGCRYSKVSNHIHCIRSGCDYVLHSTAQLYSHKRKHERRDFESAYKKYRDKSVTKPILPRTDFGSIQQVASLTGSPIIATLPGVLNLQAGLKRQAEWEHSEPLELKKPKIEPGSDVESVAASNQSARSTPSDRVHIKPDPDAMEVEASSDLDDSMDEKREELKILRRAFGDGEGLNLSGSLTLPIPMFKGQQSKKTESSSVSSPVTSPVMSQQISMSPLERLQNSSVPVFTAMPSINASMPSTLAAINPGALLTSSTFPGPATVLQPPKSVYTERREKDDSWKTYLVRYTANDPCNPRCQYLYKDHYHCKMDGCLVLFKSKDGVREHARFHELQERITPIAYTTYEEDDQCNEECQYNEKQKHYHCIWTGCTHVVPYVGPTFGRLEHYRIHEYARAAAGKSYGRSGKGLNNLDDSSMRRRGRPPKYPKIELPKIPKVELSDEEIRMSQMPLKETDLTDKMKVINGFRVFSPEDPCPDDRCNFVGKLHYHCARPRCFTITDRIDVLNLHAKDFHSFVKILEGYEFFDRNVSCRRLNCPNNQTNRHFHCTRPRCDYSFIRHSTMSQHEKKHLSSSGGLSGSELPISPQAIRRDVPLLPVGSAGGSPPNIQSPPHISSTASVITSTAAFVPIKPNGGIPFFLPQSGSVTSLPQGQVILSPQPINLSGGHIPHSAINVSSVPIPISTVQALPASVTSGTFVTGVPAPIVNLSGNQSLAAGDGPNLNNPSLPLTLLLQRGVNPMPQPSWNEMRQKMHYAVSQNCGRPFCKLKKKDHYHCLDCNQAFSDPARLRSHIGKHGIKLKRAEPGNNSVIKHVNQIGQSGPLPTDVNILDKTGNQDLDPDEAMCLTEGVDMSQDDSDVEDTKSSSLNLNPSTFSEMISKAQEQNKMSSDVDSDDEPCLHIDTSGDADANNTSDSNDHKVDVSSRSGRKIFKTKKDDFMDSGEINLNKQRQSAVNIKPNNSRQSPVKPSNGNSSKFIVSGTRGLRDDSIPEGYSRWRYNEECKYAKCAYKHSVTHFHCVRDDCGYGFSDRSRLVQHTLRHERIDSITGGELQQYRINQDCENADCEYNKKMSHFHCKRCIYSCTDSSKVLTHRKHHAKMDNISNQGFEKYFAADDCAVNLCPYARKQSHFHCLVGSCRAAVLGPVQMTSHKAKHGN